MVVVVEGGMAVVAVVAAAAVVVVDAEEHLASAGLIVGEMTARKGLAALVCGCTCGTLDSVMPRGVLGVS